VRALDLQTERFPRIDEERERRARLRNVARLVLLFGGFTAIAVMSLFDTSHSSAAARALAMSSLAIPVTLGTAIFNVADRASSTRWLIWSGLCVVVLGALYWAVLGSYL
jgi:hypothetical protein